MNKRTLSLLPLLSLALLTLCPLAHGAFASDKSETSLPAPDGQYRYESQASQPETVGIFTLTSQVTAYCPCIICCDEYSAEHPNNIGTDFVQLTASGTVPAEGRTIAVDPEVIPIGSYVQIGRAVYIAEDTGGLITGSDIDIFIDSHERAGEFGTRECEVTVYTPEHFAAWE